MNNIIKSSPWLKVLKPHEVIMLNQVHDYKHKLEEESNKVLIKAQHECAVMKNELQLVQKKSLEELSAKLYQDNHQQLNELLGELEQNLHVLVKKIMNKLQINSFSHQQITDTIKNELHEIISSQKVQVQCNLHSLELIKHNLLEFDAKISYQINDSLLNEQCVINTGMSLIYVDLADCRNKIMKLLNMADAGLIKESEFNHSLEGKDVG